MNTVHHFHAYVSEGRGWFDLISKFRTVIQQLGHGPQLLSQTCNCCFSATYVKKTSPFAVTVVEPVCGHAFIGE